MIRLDETGMHVGGAKIELMAELTSIINSMLTNKVIDEEDLDYIVNLAKMDESELLMAVKETILEDALC